MVRIALALLGVALAGRALAEEPSDPDPDTEVARRHFDLGTESYQQRDYETALREFEAARRVKKLPAFDYNIGRCLDRLERYPEAVAAYERYVAAAANARDAAEVRERIRVLKERIAPATSETPGKPPPAAPEPQPKTAPPPPPPAPAPPPAAPEPVAPPPVPLPEPASDAPPARATAPLLPLIVGGVAVAAAVAGTALYFGSALPGYQALDTGPESCRPCTPADYAGVKAVADASYGLWIVAGVVAAVDVALWVLHIVRARRAAPVETAARGAR